MHAYLFDAELVRVAIVLGIVVSILFYDRYGVTTGGAIVPGYLALFVPSPGYLVTTMVLAGVTYWIVQKHLRPRFMLWGRRLFEAEILTALVLQGLWLGFLYLVTPHVHQFTLFYGIGFLVPGIIAHDMGRQKIKATIQAALICAFIVFSVITLLGAVRNILGLPASLLGSMYSLQTYAYPTEWLLAGISLGVLVSIFLYHAKFLKRVLLPNALRTGGFVTAGYLALFVFRPLDLLFVSVCSTITYLIVTKYLMKQAILFGRSKMAAMFLTGFIVTWLAELLVFASDLPYIPWAGFTAVTPTVVALLANDAQRQGPIRTFTGVTVATVAVLFVMVSIKGTYDWLLYSDIILTFTR
jgi:poly-gamma-glutamate biosynthesis protein PgsC/CapC